MNRLLPRSRLVWLIIGDLLIVLIVTIIGFASHQQSLAGTRWLATFIPLSIGWGLASPWMGLFQAGTADRPSQFWRVLPAAVLAAPFAVILRGLWLQQTASPVFALVLMAVTTAGLGIWRLIWAFLAHRK